MSEDRTVPAAQQSVHELTHHRIPGWVSWVQDHLLMSCLILAEAYLLGSMMVTGWVSNIQTPGNWGIYNAIGVVVFFMAGATAAGVAVRASFKAALCFERHQWGMGLVNLLGCLILATVEFWANISERAPHLSKSTADKALLSLIGQSAFPLSPTLIIVAILLPLVTFFIGFTHYNEQVESVDEKEAAHQLQLAQIRFNNEKRLLQVQGGRAAFDAARTKTPGQNAIVAPAPVSMEVLGGESEIEGQAVTEPVETEVPAEPTTRSRRSKASTNLFPGSKEYRQAMVSAIAALNRDLQTVNAANVAKRMGRTEEEVAPYLVEYLANERERSLTNGN